MTQLQITALARQDLDEIWKYIAEDNVKAATNYLKEIRKVLRNLRSFPQMGGVFVQKSQVIRCVLSGNHVIYYRIENDSIVVIRVIHGARDTGNLNLS
jgi:toxin ParE1/3/4